MRLGGLAMARSRKLIAAIVVAGLVAVAGVSYAATGATTKQQPFLTDVAQRLGVSRERLDAALRGAFDDRLSAAVTAGRLTKTQAAAIEQRMAKVGASGAGAGLGIVAPAAAYGSASTHAGVFRGRLGAYGGFAPFGMAIGFGVGGSLKAVSSYIGVTSAQVVADIRSGKSIDEIATAHGKTVAGLQTAVTAALTARLNRAVTAGRITHSQEQTLITSESKFESGILSGHFRLGTIHTKPGVFFGGALRKGRLHGARLRKGAGWFAFWGA